MTLARRPIVGPIALVGCGRAGAALAAALGSRAGAKVRVWDRTPARARRTARAARAWPAPDLPTLLGGARLVIIAVSDEALGAVAQRLARAWPENNAPPVVLHTAGARPAAALRALQGAGGRLRRRPAVGVFHPVASLVGARSAAQLEGAFATVSGDRAAVAAARRLARVLRMRPVLVTDRARPLLHLAATLAAGDLVALLALAEALLGRTGAPPRQARALLGALAAGAIANYSRSGAARALLTGPAARGDAATLAEHLRALGRLGAAGRTAREAHVLLAASGAQLLAAAGRLDRAALRRIRAALAPPRSDLPRRRAPRNLPSESEARR